MSENLTLDECVEILSSGKGPYPLSAIPVWCRLHPAEHLCAGGCWSILYQQFTPNCSTCEYSRYHDPTETPNDA